MSDPPIALIAIIAIGLAVVMIGAVIVLRRRLVSVEGAEPYEDEAWVDPIGLHAVAERLADLDRRHAAGLVSDEAYRAERHAIEGSL